ncbi:hypothetical protein EFD56_16530 [Rhizobium phaseoli]|uniref:dihydroxy-acid dehydratase domain-containing protein n=1 Tax=Rhizobium phaseoli TaxID=396 RepID=UPI000F88D1F1|nr:dihydroxy-acid dehydratase [Rhizobium phaseoli]RUM17792.1 hypothetical protein EFD56_16530 [Rhizobium phaseoli]
MAHWLDPITQVFTSDAHDLAELAKMLGYDPATFYIGTLPQDQIEARVLERGVVPGSETLRSVDGNLGPAVAFMPTGRVERMTSTAVVFADEIALQEAFLDGELAFDFVAILRLSDDGAGWRPSLRNITATLEILQDRGFHVWALIDATIEKFDAGVPVVSNFSLSADVGGMIGRVRDGDKITLDADASLLVVDVIDSDLESRRLTKVSVRHRPSISNENIFAGETPERISKFISRQPRYLKEIYAKLQKTSGRPTRQAELHLRLFRNVSMEIEAMWREINEHQFSDTISSAISTIEGINDGLRQCSQFASGTRNYGVALLGFETQITTLRLSEFLTSSSRASEIGGAAYAVGNLYSAEGNAESAIRAFEDATRELQNAIRLQDAPSYRLMFANVSRRLATQLQQIKRYEDAERVLAEATHQLARWSDSITYEGQFVLARLYGELAAVARTLGRSSSGLENSRQSVEVLQSLLEVKSGIQSLEFLAKAYMRHADLLDDVGALGEAAIARVTSVLLRLRVAERSVGNKKRMEAVLKGRSALVDGEGLYSILPRMSDDTFTLVSRAIRSELKLDGVDFDEAAAQLYRLEETLATYLPRFLHESSFPLAQMAFLRAGHNQR